MQIKYSSLFLIVLFHIAVFGQDLNPEQIKKIDSLTAKLKTDSTHIYRFQKYRPYINFDQRNSFINNAPINVNGAQLGVLINEKHVVGFGGYIITANSKQKIRTKTDKNIPANRVLNMDYGTFFYQYVALDKRFFEIDLQAELGGGVYDYKYYDVNTNKQIADRSAKIIVGGLGPLLAFKPFKWIGIIGMVGYRFTFERNTNLNFNAVYYSYGVWLDVRQIIRDYNYYLVKKRKYRKEIMLVKSQCVLG
jgi:hypothetical protein